MVSLCKALYKHLSDNHILEKKPKQMDSFDMANVMKLRQTSSDEIKKLFPTYPVVEI